MPTPFFADLVRELCQEGGTGSLKPGGAVPGHRRFADAVPTGADFHYAIAGIARPGQWEVGLGRIDADGRLVRVSVAASSQDGARVDFAPGLKTIALTVGAEWFAGREAETLSLASDLAVKQPLSTGHAAVANAAAGDLVTVRRGSGWVNVPLSTLPYRDAAGRHVLSGVLDAQNGSAALPSVTFSADPDSGLFRAGANIVALATGGTEKMRVTETGHVGVGTASPAKKFAVSSGGANGFEIEPGEGNYTRLLSFNRSAGAYTPMLVEGEEIRFLSGAGLERLRVDSLGTVRPGQDNVQGHGHPSFRWSVVYAATGAINTSDSREKTWRSAPSAAERAAAQQIAAELGFYQWNDAIAEKGEDGARYHFGIRAQRLWAVMADAGLIAPLAEGDISGSKYAFLCWDKWDDVVEERPVFSGAQTDTDGAPMQIGTEQVVVRAAGNRAGIRPDQLALFLIAAQEARIAALEAAA